MSPATGVCVFICVRVLRGQYGVLGAVPCPPPRSSLSWALTCPSRQGRSSGRTALSTAPLAAVLTLQQCCDTLVFHPTLPFSFPSFPHPPSQGFLDDTEVRGARLSGVSHRGGWGGHQKETRLPFILLKGRQEICFCVMILH